MGDFNLNSEVWNIPEERKTGHERNQTEMSKMIINNIVSKGQYKIKTKTTRKDLSGKSTTLDHIYSSNPEKLSDITIIQSTSSDHAILMITRRTKQLPNTQTYIKKRNFKKIDVEKLKRTLFNIDIITKQ